MNIVFIHGALGCALDFDACVQSLQKKGFTCHCLELSGHGPSPFAPDFSIEQFSNELQQKLLAFDPKNTLLFGYSMGGYVILSYLSKNKKADFSFMTLATKWLWTEEIADKEKTLCSKEFLLEKAPAFYAALEKKHKQTDTLLTRTAALIEQLGTAARPDLSGLMMKAKIMRGTLDKLVSEEESLALTALLPNASFESLPEVKHPLEAMPVDSLVEKISDFSRSSPAA